MQALVIHGRQPAIGRAELESLYGAEALRPVGEIATAVDISPAQINFSRLGGMVKFCKILTVLDTTAWDEIEQFLVSVSPAHAKNMAEGKLTIGLSAYGLDASLKRMLATGLELKKAIKNTGRPVRLVPNKTTDLNAAQVLHNKLTQKLGWELVFVRNGNQTIVAQSIAVQDIEGYAARDQARPHRDAKVGMLPPKLAQIIINLAIGKDTGPAAQMCETVPRHETQIYDPFCGSGVIIQEALLMGYSARGSDIDPRMVGYTAKNIDWLEKTQPFKGKFLGAEKKDAIQTDIQGAACIASEVFLGRPLSSVPDPKTLGKIINDCDRVAAKFLKNVAKQTESGFRLCLAVPCWKTNNGFRHLQVLDHLTDMGYNRLSFVHASNEELIYHRANQIVARELITIERK
jgi:tRNA G10  N-methylase Trm11